MKRFFRLLVVATATIALFSGCQKYDDSDLGKQPQKEHGPSIGTYLWADNVYELGNNGASILADMYSKTHINRVILLVKGSTGRMAFLANPNKEYVQSDYGGRDILQEVIDAMHAKDIKVFAWLYCNEDYTYLSFYPEEASYHFYYGLSDSVVDVNSDSFCGYLSRLVKTIGGNYQVDGFMFDHIRYNACYYGWGKKDFLAMTSDPEIGMTLGEYNEAVKLLAETYDYSIAKDEDGRYVHNAENPEIEEYKANAIYDAAQNENAAITKLMKYRELSIDKMCNALTRACNGRTSIIALMPEVVTNPKVAALAYGVAVNDAHIFDYNSPMLYSSDFNEDAKWVREGCCFLLSHKYLTQPSLQAYRPGGETAVLAADIEACKEAGCSDYNLFQSFTYDIARVTVPEKNTIRIAYLKATESPVGTVKVNLSDASKLIDVSFNGVFSGGQYTLSDNVLTVSGENFTKVGDEGIIQLRILDGASVTSVESSRIVWMDAD